MSIYLFDTLSFYKQLSAFCVYKNDYKYHLKKRKCPLVNFSIIDTRKLFRQTKKFIEL